MAEITAKQVRISKDDPLHKCDQPENDWNSSCTNFVMPYDSVCRRRHQAEKRKYERQFLYELEMQEAMQALVL